jgi:hypothetical protein
VSNELGARSQFVACSGVCASSSQTIAYTLAFVISDAMLPGVVAAKSRALSAMIAVFRNVRNVSAKLSALARDRLRAVAQAASN